MLAEDPPNEVAIGAIGKVWQGNIPFVHVSNAEEFAFFRAPDYAKVAWAIRVLPLGLRDSRVEIEVRVDATDDEAWTKFHRYFGIIGMGSRFIRHSALSALAKQFDTPLAQENQRPRAGDGLLLDAQEQITRGITIAAAP